MTPACPKRIASVWTRTGMFDLTVEGEWPAFVVWEGIEHLPVTQADGAPLVMVGRRSGVQIVNYMKRRPLNIVAFAAHLHGLSPEGLAPDETR